MGTQLHVTLIRRCLSYFKLVFVHKNPQTNINVMVLIFMRDELILLAQIWLCIQKPNYTRLFIQSTFITYYYLNILKDEREERKSSRVGILMKMIQRRTSIQPDEVPKNLLKSHLTLTKTARVNYSNWITRTVRINTHFSCGRK